MTGRPSPASLRQVDARMINGLPEPQSQEAMDWLRAAFAELQARDERPDVDLGSIESRLAALEARPLAPSLDDILRRLAALEARPQVDLDPIWEAIALLRKRIHEVEDGLGNLENLAPPEPPPPRVIELRHDPLDPVGWQDLESAKAALLVLVTQEAAKRCGFAVELYEEMVGLDALGDKRSADQDLRLLQHVAWAKERQLVELARLQHNAAIRALESVEAARAYDWRAGWPVLGKPEAPMTGHSDWAAP